MKKPKVFGFVLKQHVEVANRFAKEVADWLTARKCKVVLAKEASALRKQLPGLKSVPKAELSHHCDLIIVFGGDGTFLSMARQLGKKPVPLLGINLGHLGFLTEVSVREALPALERILKGEFRVQERAMLAVSVLRGKKEILLGPVLNDAVITNADIARVIDLQVAIDGVVAATIKADGLIISTPTGSTAYSLAAGGPIVHPAVQATTIAAICPHSLTVRPIVVPESATIEVKVNKRDGTTLLTLDGQSGYDLKPGDKVKIGKYEKSLQVIQPTSLDYFELLRTKLKLGARGEESGHAEIS